MIHRVPLDQIRAELRVEECLAGGFDEDAFGAFLERYLNRTTRLRHPGYLAHQVAAPSIGSALADLVNGMTNNGMSIYEMGPAGGVLELAMLDWMREHIGWQRQAGGVLTHGGALANLTALAAARASAAPEAWDEGCPRDLVVLAPKSCHYSISRSVALLGLGEKSIVQLPVDELDRYREGSLGLRCDELLAAGKRIMAVVLSACSTATGLFDPLVEAASVCRERGIWLHVDGAHGASALISPQLRERLRGIEAADSLIWDAHKLLGTSALATAVLVRERKKLSRTFKQKASYIIRSGPSIGVNQARHSLECTKSPLALKLFLALALKGEQQLAADIELLFSRTQGFYEQINRRSGFSCPYVPESNILCFRRDGLDNDAHEQIRQSLMNEGEFYLSGADVSDRYHLRLTVMNTQSDEATIERLLDAIERVAG